MKKLLSITAATSLAATSASTLVACSTTLLTNPYTINFGDTELINDLYNKIRYEWDDTQKEYVIKNTATVEDSQKTTDVKSSMNGANGAANTIVQELMNVIFFNSEVSAVNHKTLEKYQYLFSTDVKGIYVDGQSRTAIEDRNKTEEVDKYYESYEASGKGIASILGLYDYWNNKGNPSKSEEPIPQLGDDASQVNSKLKMINEMFTTSANQGITNVKFTQKPYFVNGQIALISPEAATTPITDANYKTPWISEKHSNYSKAAEYGSTEKNTDHYIAGTSSAASFDPFAQTLISAPTDDNGEEDLKNDQIRIKEVSKEDYEKLDKPNPGEILNKKGAEFHYYWTTDSEGKKSEITSDIHGYQLVELEPLNMEINYNSNLKLTNKENNENDYLGDNFKISLTVDGLNAVYAPFTGYISNDSESSDVDTNLKDKNQLYLGWKLVGYQFNDTEILGYDSEGKALDSSSREFSDDKIPFTKNKFDDFAITSFDIEKL